MRVVTIGTVGKTGDSALPEKELGLLSSDRAASLHGACGHERLLARKLAD